MLLLGVAAAVAAGVGVMLWSVGPTYSLLYSNLAPEDAAQVTQALDSARIPYKLEDGASRGVPAEQLAAARLKLAAQGLPEGGGGVNAMTKDPGFGVSAFMESARYHMPWKPNSRAPSPPCRTCRAHACTWRWRGSRPSSAIASRLGLGIPAAQGRPPAR